MRVGRWAGMSALPALVMVVYIFGVLAGSFLKGWLDSVFYGLWFAFATGAVAALGVALGRRNLLRGAEWTLPLGVAAAMIFWIQLPSLAGHGGAVLAAFAVWVVALTALAATAKRTARPSGKGRAVVVAGVGGTALVMLVPYLVVRWVLGPEQAPWTSAAAWATVGVTDYRFGWDINRIDAMTTASAPAIMVMVGTAFTLAYVLAQTGADVAGNGAPNRDRNGVNVNASR